MPNTHQHSPTGTLLYALMLAAFWLLFLIELTLGSPAIELSNEDSFISPAVSADGAWLFNWAWPGDGTVTVVDRQPPISYDARPAMFGPKLEEPLMGYVIPLSSFTTQCPTNESHPILLVEHDGYRGTVAATLDDNCGCPKLCVAGPRKPERSETWIALVQRGECGFVEKVREAQRLGANAVVVGGYNEDSVNMYNQGDASDVTIPSAYIPLSSYLSLFNLIKASNTTTSGLRTVSIQLAFDYGAWEWYSPFLTFALLLLLPSLLTLSTLLIHRVRLTRAQRRERAPQDIVASLPWRVWGGEGWEKWPQKSGASHPCNDDTPPPASDHPTSPEHVSTATTKTPTPSPTPTLQLGDLESGSGPSDTHHPRKETETEHTQGSPLPCWFRNQTECAICLSDFENGDRVRILPCNHIFHMDEVDSWLVQRKKLCPVCKGDVTSPNGEPPVEREAESQAPQSPPPPTETTPLLGSR